MVSDSRKIKFILLNSEEQENPANRITPVILAVPEEIPIPSEDKAKEWVNRIVSKRSWNRRFVISENDAANSPEIRAMFDSVEWSEQKSVWFDLPKDFHEAYDYVTILGVPAPSVEALIAQDTYSSYRYSVDFLGARFDRGEQSIARDIVKSINYARINKCRIKAAEDSICKNDDHADNYGEIMRQNALWDSWTEDDLIRSPVWMYQYAKDYVGGQLPDSMHNAMHLLSISMPSNKWIRKYFKAKKYMSKNLRRECT